MISEAALLSRFCPVEVVLQQLRFLSVLRELPNIKLAVLPSTAALPKIPLNSFIVFDSSMVWIETSGGMLTLTDDRDIRLHQESFESYLGESLTREGARSFILGCVHRLSDLDGDKALK